MFWESFFLLFVLATENEVRWTKPEKETFHSSDQFMLKNTHKKV